jgi:hypothetical protein
MMHTFTALLAVLTFSFTALGLAVPFVSDDTAGYIHVPHLFATDTAAGCGHIHGTDIGACEVECPGICAMVEGMVGCEC